jgi:cation:H+ antiporter
MGSLSTGVLGVLFAIAVVVTWVAGIYLSKSTDQIDRRYNLGDALGGVILLAVAGSLPELAITVSAASSGHLDIAAGNLIGGIAIQTMVIVLLDAAASRTQALTYLVGSLIPVLEGLLVAQVVALVMMGALLPEHVSVGPVSPASIAIVVTWLAGVYTLNRVRNEKRWQVAAPGSSPGRTRRQRRHPEGAPKPTASVAHRAIAIFTAASLITLGAGVVLEVAGNTLADRAGINGVIFGATVLGFATALPEISSGLAAVKAGDHELAIADIFGGNAFQVSLFLVADLIAGKPVLPFAGKLNAWLAGLSIVLTAVYAWGVIVRREGVTLRLGLDSIFVLVLFGLGIAGLVSVSNG